MISDHLSEALIAGDTEPLRRLFAAKGLRAPTVVWSPDLHDLSNPILTDFATRCRRMSGSDGRMRESEFHLGAFGPLLDYMMLVAPEQNSARFRYIHYGNAIVQHYGRDMTHATTDDFPVHISAFFGTLYRSIIAKGVPVLSEHEPPKQVFVRLWKRLIFPVFNDRDDVACVCGINFPENELRMALELQLDPIFLITPEGATQYANRAARLLFGIDYMASDRPTFEQLTGIDTEFEDRPEELLDRRIGLGRRMIETGTSTVGEFDVIVSSVLFRESVYHMVTLRGS